MDILVPYRHAPLENLVNSHKSVSFYVAYEFNTLNERSQWGKLNWLCIISLRSYYMNTPAHYMDSLVPYRHAPLEDLVNSLKSVTFYFAYEFNTSNERSKWGKLNWLFTRSLRSYYSNIPAHYMDSLVPYLWDGGHLTAHWQQILKTEFFPFNL